VPEAEFTPAAGRFLPTSAYDRLLVLLTREATWRARLLAALGPKPGERILDVGSGTGSLAILIKQMEPQAIVVGLDPDPDARRIAAAKAEAAGVEIEWLAGFARDAANFGLFDKIVSSLVFHQVPLAEKSAGIEAMFKAARPGGANSDCRLCHAAKLADAGRQDSNLRPSAPKADALPGCATPRPGFRGRPTMICGGGGPGRIRTRDLAVMSGQL
jgi:ubiquinone/menaquinone biosynthesis C-methylase UbiE